MSSESEVFIGYADSASQHTQRLASTAWVIFTPRGQLLSSRGICLGDTTNNVAEYSAVIELFRDALSFGISHLQVYLEGQLVVSQCWLSEVTPGLLAGAELDAHQIIVTICLKG
jgi:ribonuclease HI